MNLLNTFSDEQIVNTPPKFEIGDSVKVYIRIVEGDKKRTQIFEGVVIAKKNSGVSETFTVRRISYGVGTEKIFPLHSPNIENVVVTRHGKVRRAKLYYLRGKIGKDSKVKEKIQ